MIAKDYIEKGFPTLTFSSKRSKAQKLFLENCICHLPVLKRQTYIGLITSEVVISLPDDTTDLKEAQNDLMRISAEENESIMEVFNKVAGNGLTSIPVVQENGKYSGSILCRNLIASFNRLFSFHEPGGVIVLNIGIKDYSLTEIANLVEMNNAKISSLFTSLNSDATRLLITLKLNTTEVGKIVATFRRFNYEIAVQFSSGNYEDSMRERYDNLIRFLNT